LIFSLHLVISIIFIFAFSFRHITPFAPAAITPPQLSPFRHYFALIFAIATIFALLSLAAAAA
jgi:hypothetical protein